MPKLSTPIPRGDKDPVKSVEVRKPTAGELRGLNLTDLLKMDVNALTKLLPRVTLPALTTADVEGMDPADLLLLGGEVVGFLASPAAIKAAMAAEN